VPQFLAALKYEIFSNTYPNTTAMKKNKPTLNKPVSTIWLGIFLIAAGLTAAAKQLHYNVPSWLGSWPMAIITGGILLGIYQRFKTFFWLIPVFVGAYLMALQQAPLLNIGQYAAASLVMLAGVILIATQSGARHRVDKQSAPEEGTADEIIAAHSFLCNTKRFITSQHFKGAEASCILGNTLIDLREADIQDTAHINVTTVLGNTKIYIPQHWAMRNNTTAVLGDIRQKNTQSKGDLATTKLIVIDGTAILGNIAIISC